VSKRIASAIALAIVLPALFVALSAAPALAHEERVVGKYHLAVGFGDEPAYAGVENSVQMFIHTADDQPVTDLGNTLKVDVIFGSKSMSLEMEPFFEVGEFGTPGDYRAFFIPTSPGNYTFRFTGTILGQKINERFTSSPTTFSSVTDPASVQFPVKAPSNVELATRIQQESERTTDMIDAAQSSAESAASDAKTIAWVGVIVGALGLITAVVALARKRA
jgi:hypothetical protein